MAVIGLLLGTVALLAAFAFGGASLKITQETYDKVISHAKKDFPIEACGYLAEKDQTVQKHYELENMDKSGIHFSFEPKDQFDGKVLFGM